MCGSGTSRSLSTVCLVPEHLDRHERFYMVPEHLDHHEVYVVPEHLDHHEQYIYELERKRKIVSSDVDPHQLDGSGSNLKLRKYQIFNIFFPINILMLHKDDLSRLY